MKWLMTIEKKYIQEILAGRKRIELRTRIPRDMGRGDYLFVVEKGSGGLIVLKMKVVAINRLHPSLMYNSYRDMLCIEKEDYFRYVMGRTFVYGILLSEVEKLKSPVPCNTLGIQRPPHWFVDVSAKSICPSNN